MGSRNRFKSRKNEEGSFSKWRRERGEKNNQNQLKRYTARLEQLRKIKNPNDWQKNQIRHAVAMKNKASVSLGKTGMQDDQGDKGQGPKSNPVGSKPDPKTWPKGDTNKSGTNGNKNKGTLKVNGNGDSKPFTNKASGNGGSKSKPEFKDVTKDAQGKDIETYYEDGKMKWRHKKPVTNKKNEEKSEPKKSNVFTRHYKTGKELGVMTRKQREAYDKEAHAAGGKSFDERVAATGDKSNKRETKYIASQRKKKKQNLKVTNKKEN